MASGHFCITQKFFHYYESSQDVKQNMHGLSDERKVGSFFSLPHVKELRL